MTKEKALAIIKEKFNICGEIQLINVFENGFIYSRTTEYVRFIGIYQMLDDDFRFAEIIEERFKD